MCAIYLFILFVHSHLIYCLLCLASARHRPSNFPLTVFRHRNQSTFILFSSYEPISRVPRLALAVTQAHTHTPLPMCTHFKLSRFVRSCPSLNPWFIHPLLFYALHSAYNPCLSNVDFCVLFSTVRPRSSVSFYSVSFISVCACAFILFYLSHTHAGTSQYIG